MTIKTLMLAGVAGAALVAAVPFSPQPVLAQNTIVAPDEGQSSDQSSQNTKKHRMSGQSNTQSSQEMNKHPMDDQSNDDQASRDMKKHRMSGQSNDDQASRDMRRNGRLAMDRDGHGERMRHREGRYRYFHDGYYYATPWWTTGIVVGGGVDGGGIGCREGARIVSGRGFNRVSPISCGGETYSYHGWRGGDPWRIRIDSDTGRIVSVRPGG
jgi:hypothetical protein